MVLNSGVINRLWKCILYLWEPEKLCERKWAYTPVEYKTTLQLLSVLKKLPQKNQQQHGTSRLKYNGTLFYSGTWAPGFTVFTFQEYRSKTRNKRLPAKSAKTISYKRKRRLQLNWWMHLKYLAFLDTASQINTLNQACAWITWMVVMNVYIIALYCKLWFETWGLTTCKFKQFSSLFDPAAFHCILKTMLNAIMMSFDLCNHLYYYLDTSVLLENTPLVKFIRIYIRNSSGVLSISSVVRIWMTRVWRGHELLERGV